MIHSARPRLGCNFQCAEILAKNNPYMHPPLNSQHEQNTGERLAVGNGFATGMRAAAALGLR